MRKSLYPLLFVLLLVGFAHVTYAINPTATAPTSIDAAPATQPTTGTPATIDPGTSGGTPCVSNGQPGTALPGKGCVASSGDAATIDPGTAPAVSSGNTPPADAFVPLTKLPGIPTSASSGSSSLNFITFFNNLYKICIGFAAALAFFQIVRAGITWMTAGDNTERVSQARSLITNSIFGLILVLSPVIIFSVINPNILSLQLNVSGLAAYDGATGTPGGDNKTSPGSGTGGGTITQGNACTGGDCATGLACNDQGICEPPAADNTVNKDGDCSGNDNACMTGLVCNNVGQCEAPNGNGSVGANGDCSGNENACTNGNICNDSGVCVPIPGGGTVAQNGSCLGNSNACMNGLTCDDDSDTCQPDTTSDNGTGATVDCGDGTTADTQADCTNGNSGDTGDITNGGN